MNQLIEYLSRLFSSWKFWIVVAPWDVAVRVRLGKHAKALAPGLHFRVPGLDDITIVNTRLRICTTPTQTLPGSMGRTRCVAVTIGFRVRDPLASMLHYSFPAPVLQAFVQAKIVADGGVFDGPACLADLRAHVTDGGLDIDFAYASTDVEVRTYRLLNGHSDGIYSGTPDVMPAGAPTSY